MLDFNSFLDISEGKRGKKRRAKERAKKRGSYQNTKLIRKKMPADDAEKASDDVLKDIVARGGASAGSAAAELKKRDVEVPEKGSEDPNDDPMNKGEGDTTKEPQPKEEPKDEKEPDTEKEPEDEKEPEPEGDDEPKDDAESEGQKELDDAAKEVEDAIDDAIEGDDEEEEKAEYDWDVISSRLKLPSDTEKETQNKLEKFLEKNKIGQLLQKFIEAEPADLTNVTAAQEDLLQTIVSKINDKLDSNIEIRQEKEAEQDDVDDLVGDATEKDLDDLIKKGGVDSRVAKKAKKEIKRLKKKFNSKSNDDLKDIIRKGGNEGKEAQKELDVRKNRVDRAKEQLSDKYGSLDKVDFELAKQVLGSELAQELVDLGSIKKELKTKKEESYQNLYNTILEMREESNSNYKNLHNAIRDVWGIGG